VTGDAASAIEVPIADGTGEKLLIVNADDYGYTAGVSEGIRQAHRRGIVTSTSVMMTMPNAVPELRRISSEAPSLGVGIHLTVTEGRPYKLPRFFAPKTLAAELAVVENAELRSEWKAQVEAFLAVGIPLTHLDSHHHAAYRDGAALAVLFELAREYGVPVRNPYPIGDAEADALAGRFADSHVRHPSRFVDVFDKDPLPATLLHTVETLPVGLTEFMCHPGLIDDELRRLHPTYAEGRAAELVALADSDVRAAIRRLGIKLVSFRALAAPRRS
jgi:chitin disaccharide deacetylase